MKRLLMATVFAFGINTAAIAQGIPTYDVTAVSKMLEQIKQGKQQIESLQNQLKQMQDLHKSLNGTTGASIQDLLGKDTVKNALPDNYADYMKMIQGGGSGATADYAKQYRQQHEYKMTSTGGNVKQETEAFYRNALEAQKDRNAGQAATGQAMYESAVESQVKITELAQALEKAETPKQVQDLQAQLIALQAKIQADTVKMQALTMAHDAERLAAEAREEDLRRQISRQLTEELNGMGYK